MPVSSDITEVKKHDKSGYQVCIDSAESWIVAINNAGPASDPDEVTFFGSHPNTDETFILVNGKACLAVAPPDEPERFTVFAMEQGACCNVKRNTWHTVLMAPGAKVAICENRAPASNRFQLSPEGQRRLASESKALLG